MPALLAFAMTGTRLLADPETPDADPHLYDATPLLEAVSTAPIISRHCEKNDCAALAPYFFALHGLRQDLDAYLRHSRTSKDVAYEQFTEYIRQTADAEELEAKLRHNLSLKNYFGDLGSNILDLASIARTVKSSSADSGLDATALDQLATVLSTVDATLAKINLAYRALERDASKDASKDVSKGLSGSEAWAGFYSSAQAALGVTHEAITAYRLAKKATAPLEDLKAAKALNRANLLAAVGQLLNVWSSYERNQMSEAIKQLEAAIASNQDYLPKARERYNRRIGHLDTLQALKRALDQRYWPLYGRYLECGLPFPDYRAKAIGHDRRNYVEGLRHFKELLQNREAGLASAWADIAACPDGKYQFAVHDAAGERYAAYIRILRSSDGALVASGNTFRLDVSPRFTLPPGLYDIEISEGETRRSDLESGVQRVSATTIHNYSLGGADEKKPVDLHPFGRVVMEVTDADGKPIAYRYEITRSPDGAGVESASASRKLSLDLPLHQALDITLSARGKSRTYRKVFMRPGQPRHLKLTFDPATSDFVEPVAPDLPDLSGLWVSDDYNCEDKRHKTIVRVIHSGNHLTAVKVDSGNDACVPSGNVTFRMVVDDWAGSAVFTVGHPDRPASGVVRQRYRITNKNRFHIGDMQFVRMDE